VPHSRRSCSMSACGFTSVLGFHQPNSSSFYGKITTIRYLYQTTVLLQRRDYMWLTASLHWSSVVSAAPHVRKIALLDKPGYTAFVTTIDIRLELESGVLQSPDTRCWTIRRSCMCLLHNTVSTAENNRRCPTTLPNK
jgi:hypothetical protein